jgi:hypothetical protein
LLFIEGRGADRTFGPGPGLELKPIAPDWTPAPASTCAEARVPALEFGPLPTIPDALIVERRSLGANCFGVVLAPPAALPPSMVMPPPRPDGGALPDASADAIAPSTPDASDIFDGRPPPTSADRVLRFCMPEELFPFNPGDRIDVTPSSVTSRGTTPQRSVRLVKSTQSLASSPPSACGFVREPCGAIWRPRRYSVSGLELQAGTPLRLGGTTYYVARAMEVVLRGSCELRGAFQFEYVEVSNAF